MLQGEEQSRLRAEERWVNSIFKPMSKISPEEDICGKEEEEEEEEEETGNKTLLQVPRRESVWGLVAWPKSSREQALWWEDVYFSLPPLPGPCLGDCSLSTKAMLHSRPTPVSRSTPQTFPSLSSKEGPTSLGDQPQMEPQSASHMKIPKIGPRLPPKTRPQAFPKGSSAPQALRQLAPMAVWPSFIIKTPAKSSPLKGQHAPSARKASHSPGAHDNPLPYFSSK
ncbi:PREDICTED: uncharacterized protein LOC103599443 [Galeopterus variegatus]|uniref:Uncharacterized protein LOC103599443 n=1 Tax=Galeopterus variegatus TaxID=482537 RepID=A0ABM0RME2_GALVR|nr:PREDICTED: uncharacterized protein LOC103599443 [Galeopterus variegatus]